MESSELPQLTGVVIISLPPSDNPSLGKTITAFTVTNSDSYPSQTQQTLHQNQPSQLSIQSPLNPETNLSSRKTLIGNPRIILGILGISIIALFLWASSSQTLFEVGNSESSDDDDDQKLNSFLFTLYPKVGIQEMSPRNVVLQLGKFVDVNSRKVVSLADGVVQNEIKRVSTAASSVLPVRGDTYPDGLYYTQIVVGSPPSPYFLDVDTGSDLTWIQCDAPCTSCAKGAHPFYKPRKGNIISSRDSVCHEVQGTLGSGVCETCPQCDYEIEYADHSSSMGVLVRDDLQLADANGTLMNSNFVFGCAYDQQGLLLNSLTKTDGILGLSRAKVSLPSQLARQGIVDNVMGHCLTTDARSGGYMFLGNDYVPQEQLAWVPMLDDISMNSYIAEIGKMTYGNKHISLDGQKNGHKRIVFDSGSSYTYFTKQAYSDLVAAIKGVLHEGLILDTSDKALPICWGTKSPIRSVEDVRKFFKLLTVQLGRKKFWVSTYLHIPPEGYLIISHKGNVCLGILDGSELDDGSTSTIILGDISMRGQLVVYDNVNQKIGWMQSDCVKPQRFKSVSTL